MACFNFLKTCQVILLIEERSQFDIASLGQNSGKMTKRHDEAESESKARHVQVFSPVLSFLFPQVFPCLHRQESLSH